MRGKLARTVACVLACCGTSAALGQDSVALTPGGNDALSSYDASSQRVRYAVDLTPVNTSWSNPILVGPLMKASRDIDPMFRTQIVGSIAASPNLALNTVFASKAFSVWSTPGAGVHPTANSAAGSVNSTGFRVQFGVALSDFSLSPSNAVGAVVGREPGNFNRLLVERVVGAVSRGASASQDSSTVSLGAIDALGTMAVRADAYNAPTSLATRLLGDNILRISTVLRGAGLNSLSASGGTNTAGDAGAATFVVSNETNPTNTPTMVFGGGASPFALVYDFAGRFRAGSTTANLTSTTGHLPPGILGHRGNPSFTMATPLVTTVGGNLGTMASIAATSSGAIPNRLMAFGLNAGAAGAPPVVTPSSSRNFQLTTPITSSAGGFTGNVAGTAVFNQYLSQTSWRGGNGQVGIGTTTSGQLVLAAVADDAAAGSYVAVVTANTPSNQSWDVAAHAGMPVKSGPGGAAIGALSASNLQLSSPSVDRSGNVFFVGSWQPNVGPAATGVFRSARTGAGYQLELLLSTGQQIAGANSGRNYTISQLTLSDSNSLASGTMFSGSMIQERDPLTNGSTARSIRSFGGLVISAVITYDNGGTPEAYDTVLFVGPQEGIDCVADFNGGGVGVQDIFDFLNAWFQGLPSTDVNLSGASDIQDIFDFLNAWFAGC